MEAAAAKGASIPALVNRPVLMPHLHFYMDAFGALGYDRPIGMVAGPIPWSSLDRYAQRFDVGDFRVFEFFIRTLEAVQLEHEAKNRG